MEAQGSSLIIDGQFVELRNGSDKPIGIAKCASEVACAVTVSNGQGGRLNYYSAEKLIQFISRLF